MDKNILIVDDEPNFLKLLASTLTDEGYSVKTTQDPVEALAMAEKELFDLIITDLAMHGLDGLDLMEKINTYYPGLPVIIITGVGTIELAVESIKKGAYDFITKPFELEKISVTIKKALEHGALCRELTNLRKEVQSKYQFNVIGQSKPMAQIFSLIKQVSDTTATIIIQGESGTGKEVLAKAIHYESSRRKYPFSPIDCGALSESLLESELFGHEKGAFTGAYRARPGLFEAAKGGTVFLDELQDMPMGTQSKLLRVLQEKEVRPVGSDQINKIDVRIIAASNINLKEAVHKGKFREDLYYRLAIVPLTLPPLRKRKEDIPLLVSHFLEKFNRSNNKNIKGITKEALVMLMEHTWPGNIRELENVLERAVLTTHGDQISPHCLYIDKPMFSAPGNHNHIKEGQTLLETVEISEKLHITEALKKAQDNRSKAAKELGISRRTLYDKIEKYNIDISKE
ncbi:MAG: sigma-54-dependent transcriptional regulator [bacterium]